MTPGPSLLDDSQPSLRATHQPPLNEALPDPMNFFADEFILGLMSNTDEYATSDVAGALGPTCDSYEIDGGIDPSELEFTNSSSVVPNVGQSAQRLPDIG